MIYLTTAELLHVAGRVLGTAPAVRDLGLLEAAAARPQASMLGSDAYPTLELKAAALTHSVARNHALIDGNKRLALGALIAFLGINGRRLTMTNDEAYEFIYAISAGQLDEIADIASAIRRKSAKR